jgi:2-oxoglutarate dehydrogenase E1 component
MNRSTVGNRSNLDLVEQLYTKWCNDPNSVDASWQAFFEGYSLGSEGQSATGDEESGRLQSGVTRLIDAYRDIGHYLADLDPLELSPPRESHELLDLGEFSLSEADLDRTFYTKLFPTQSGSLRDIIAALRQTYSGKIGIEFMHISNRRVRQWLQEKMEPQRNQPNLNSKQKRRILLKLYSAELLETFLHTHYMGQKRFSLEGGETLIPLLDSIIETSGSQNVNEIVMGMPHRGRLNVLTNILEKPYGLVFGEFEGNIPNTVGGDGDVKYHLGFSSDHYCETGEVVHLTLCPNPSHLEAVDPVVEGRTRAKQRKDKNRDRRKVLPILIHGDAAFAGQGLVAETLNLSQLRGYKTGGTIHVVVNNQIGFTTFPMDSRSSRYCTDVAKMIEVPIFHVNGEDPEAVAYVASLASEFRQTFQMDVVIDLVCYRRHGHNEGDEPAFTQPLMYQEIRKRSSIRQIYTDRLVASGELTQDEAETLAETFKEKLEKIYIEVHNEKERKTQALPETYSGSWTGLKRSYDWTPVETGVQRERLAHIAQVSCKAPEGFTMHPTLERVLAPRIQQIADNGPINWGFAECLAFGSLAMDGTPVRLSGQDCGRGTFSQRHSVLTDFKTGDRYVPLQHLSENQADFSVYDSMLSEAAVLGFEYGYSLDMPKMLILWEAQFGDFANGAQVIIDQFIASAESKWGRSSGLVMLLPHGYEGQGPEHSSGRVERFLQLCASTPAQYFHLLRRQVNRTFRKPLVVMTPKSLLRHKNAVSTVDELVSGRFHEVLDDSTVQDPRKVRKVLLCSGKVYYDLIAKRELEGKEGEVAIVRVEQLHPWPAEILKPILNRYADSATQWTWVQEESQNNGYWSFVSPRLHELMGWPFDYVGRDASASPATGSHHVHEHEQAQLVEAAVLGSGPNIISAQSRHESKVMVGH